jgi:hypothetical protein
MMLDDIPGNTENWECSVFPKGCLDKREEI